MRRSIRIECTRDARSVYHTEEERIDALFSIVVGEVGEGRGGTVVG